MAKLKLTQDIANKVINLDCNTEDGVRRLKKSLMKLPFIKDESDLETDRLEKIINKVEAKYDIQLSYLMRVTTPGHNSYSGMLRGKGFAWVKTVYGMNINETLQKALFYMFYHIESEKEKESG